MSGARGLRYAEKNPGRISFFSSPSVFSWRKYPLKLMPSLAGGEGCSTTLCPCREAPAQDLAYTCPIAVEEANSRDAQGARLRLGARPALPQGLAVPV